MFIQNNMFIKKSRVHVKFFFQVQIRSTHKNKFAMKCIDVVDSDGNKFGVSGGVFKKWKKYTSGWYSMDRNYWPKCA